MKFKATSWDAKQSKSVMCFFHEYNKIMLAGFELLNLKYKRLPLITITVNSA